MPELPEVETVRCALDAAITGGVISEVLTSGKTMRWPIPPALGGRITGAVITGVRRRGKYILIDIEGVTPAKAHRAKTHRAKPNHGKTNHSGATLAGTAEEMVMLIHLGMSGSVRIYDHRGAIRPEKHDHMILDMAAPAPAPAVTMAAKRGLRDDKRGNRRIILNDPRRFGGVDLMPRGAEHAHPLLAHLGIEPLGNRLGGDFLRDALSGKNTAIKTALLDQRIIAGIGNIYAAEACYRAGIHPSRKAGRISTARCGMLADAIRAVLQEAVEAGGTSLRDHIQPGGEIGYFALKLNVYGREGEACPGCTTPIRLIRQAGRASYYCPSCQH